MMDKTVWHEEYWTRSGQHEYPNEELCAFVARRHLGRDCIVLELGPGTGNNAWMFVERGVWLNMVDISEPALDLAYLALEQRFHGSYDVSSMICDLRTEPLHYDDEMFAAVVEVHCLQHLTFTQHAPLYKEIHRVLKPGGYFFSVHLNSDTYDWQKHCGIQTEFATLANVTDDGIYPNCGPTCFPSEYTMVEWMQQAGFSEWQIDKLDRTRKGRTASWFVVEAKK